MTDALILSIVALCRDQIPALAGQWGCAPSDLLLVGVELAAEDDDIDPESQQEVEAGEWLLETTFAARPGSRLAYMNAATVAIQISFTWRTEDPDEALKLLAAWLETRNKPAPVDTAGVSS